MCSSKWDGVYEPVTEAKTPVYFVIGEKVMNIMDQTVKEAYQILYELYAEQGLAKIRNRQFAGTGYKRENYFAGTKVTISTEAVICLAGMKIMDGCFDIKSHGKIYCKFQRSL